MFAKGKKMKKGFVLLAFVFSVVAYADEGQHLSDTIDFETPLEKSLRNKEIKDDGAFLEGDPAKAEEELTRRHKNVKKTSPNIGEVEDLNPKISEKEKLRGQNAEQFGSHENDENYLETDAKIQYKKIARSGEHNFALLFYKDTYTYHDDQNSFMKTYRGEGSSPSFLVRFSGHNFLFHHAYADLGLGIGAGIGYNSGSGRYSGTDTIAPARLFLWTLPLDLSLAAEAPVTRFFKLGVAAGPSVMGLWQHRSDLEDGQPNKNLRQVSMGYFAEGKLNISLSDLDLRKSVSMFNEYSVTKMFFSLSARMHRYEKFKDSDVTINGSSLGAGFTFEYL